MFHKNNKDIPEHLLNKYDRSNEMCRERGVIRNPTKQPRPNTSKSGLKPLSESLPPIKPNPKKECEHKWVHLKTVSLDEFIDNVSFYCEKCLKTKIIQLDYYEHETNF